MRLDDLLVPSPPARGELDPPSAAVLIALTREDDPRLILTRRSFDLLHHAGQVSLPGGVVDIGETPAEAAVREAWEEVGLEPGDVEILGCMASFRPSPRRTITPVVARIPADVEPYPASPAEVASVLMPSLSELVSDKVRVTATMTDSGYTGPAFEVAGTFVWGLTGHLLDHFLDLADLSSAWDRDRRIEVPSEYRASRRWADD